MSEELNNTNEKPTKPKREKKPKSLARKIVEWTLTIVFGGLFLFVAIGQIQGMVKKKDNYNQTLTYGLGSFIITTDSMEPEYPVNTAIITFKEKVENIYQMYLNNETVDITFFDYYDSNNYTYDYIEHHPTKEVTIGDDTFSLTTKTRSINAVMTHRLREVFIDEAVEYGKGRYTFVVSGINISTHQAQKGQYQLLTENEILGIVKVKSAFLGGFFKFITSPWGLLVFLLVPASYLVITSVLDIFKAIKDPEEEGAAAGKESSSGSSGNAPASLEGLSKEELERLKREMLEEMMNKKGNGKDGK